MTPATVSARLFHCARCHCQVILCRRCDRGQRYCDQGCSAQARQDSQRRAAKHYARFDTVMPNDNAAIGRANAVALIKK